jgi:hypothetical protein
VISGLREENVPREQMPSALDNIAAQRLARSIERYWAEHGHSTVSCRVERVSVGVNRHTVYVVKSNLMRGLPPEQPCE